MKINVLNKEGQETGKKLELSELIFGVEPNEHAIYLDVKQYLANQRQGTHKSKERNEITGSGRKVKKQKGTGTARAGDIKNPLFRGGGRVFGPEPRDYRFKLNKKQKLIARTSALSMKAKNNEIIVLEDLDFADIKTKQVVQILINLGVQDKKVLFVIPEYNKNLLISSKNLPKSKVSLAQGLNTYGIMNAQHIIATTDSVKKIEETLA